MNIIRTTAVELTTIPAIAYKQKLASGGAGVKMLRLDQEASGVVTIDRRTGEGIPYGSLDTNLFPDEAVYEAIDLTGGLPYSARGKIKVKPFEEAKEAEDVEDMEPESVDMVGSEEYTTIIERYKNEKGKLNYELLNKDFIQFASKSKMVSNMVSENAQVDDILLYIIKSRSAYLTGKKESLTDFEAASLIKTLDEINPRSAFKELTAFIRRIMARSSK